jgi:hypothetical protein
MYGGTPIHGVEKPAQEEAEDESPTSTYSPTYDGKNDSETKQARHDSLWVQSFFKASVEVPQ